MADYVPARSLGDVIPEEYRAEPTTVGDYFRPAVAAVGDLGAQGCAISRYFNEKIGDTDSATIDRINQQQNQDWADSVRAGMSNTAREGLESSVLSSDFWEHPIRNAMLKSSAMAPAMIAGMLPGGLIGDAWLATTAAAGTNAALNVGAFLNDVDQKVDKAADADLQKQSDYYAGLRQRMDEPEARKEFKNFMASDKGRLALLAIVGAAAGVTTPGGVIARTTGKDVINEAERSALGHALVHGGEGAFGMGVQSGTSSAVSQNAAIAGGFQKEFDLQQWFSEVAEGMGLGGIMSGATGALTGKRPAKEKVTDEGKKPKVEIQEAPEKGPDATEQAVTGTQESKPNVTEPVNTEQQPAPKQETAPPAAPEPPARRLPGDLEDIFIGSPFDERVYPERTSAPREEDPVAQLRREGFSGDALDEEGYRRYGKDWFDMEHQEEAPAQPSGGAPQDEQVRQLLAAFNRTEEKPVVRGPNDEAARQAIADLDSTGRTRESMAKRLNDEENIPEAKPQLDAQRDQAGERKAILYTNGETAPNNPPEGFKRTKTKAGVIDYDPTKVTNKEVMDHVKNNTLNDLLELGPHNKEDVAASVAAGHEPVAVVARTPEGVATREAASTTELAPKTAEVMARTKKSNEATVAIEPVKNVLDGRANGKGKPDDLFAVNAGDRPAPKDTWVPPSEADSKLVTIGGMDVWVRDNKLVGRVDPETGENTWLTKAQSATFTGQFRVQLRKMREKGETPEASAPKSKRETTKQEIDRLAKEQAADKARKFVTQSADFDKVVAARDSADALAKPSNVDLTPKEKVEPSEVRKVELTDEEKQKKVEEDNRNREAKARAEEQNKLAKATKEASQKLAKTKDPEQRRQEAVEKRADQIKKEMAAHGYTIKDEQALRQAERDIAAAEAKAKENNSQIDFAARRWLDDTAGAPDAAGHIATGTERAPEPNEIKQSYPLSVAIHAADESKFDNVSKPMRMLLDGLKKRLEDTIGHVDVHVVTQETMDSLNPNKPAGTVKAYFDADKNHIVISDRHVGKNGAMDMRVLAHEGMHALIDHALERDTNMQRVINRMIDHLRSETDEYYHGFKDPHEFIAEALSSPKFQELLMETKAPKDLIAELKLDKAPGNGSMWSAMIESIRQFVLTRMPWVAKDGHNMMSAVLRVVDKLDQKAEVIRAVEQKEPATPRRFMESAGNFTPEGNEAHQENLDQMFRVPLKEALLRDTSNLVQMVRDPVFKTAEFISKAATDPRGTMSEIANRDRGTIAQRAASLFTTNDQFRQAHESKLPMIRGIFDQIEKAGVYGAELKERGTDIAAALYRAQQAVPGAFDRFADLIQRQTMYGVDASSAIGEGRNKHLELTRAAEKRMRNPSDQHAAPMKNWEARNAHASLKADYDALVKEHPEFAKLQKAMFDYYDQSHAAMTKGILDHILRTYEFDGTPAERAAMVDQLYNNRLSDDMKSLLEAKIGSNAVSQIINAQAFKKIEGPYAPLMRRGEHVVLGEYKLPEAKNAINRPEPNVYEFKTAKEAHDFAVNSGLHFNVEKAYYDNTTGEKTTKVGGLNTSGGPEERFAVTLQNKHVEFHENREDALASHKALHASGEFENLAVGERDRMQNMEGEFTGRGVMALIKSLEQQGGYKSAPEEVREQLRNTIKEAGIRAMSGNRVQSRRLPRRRVEGASNDILRNLYDYNNSAMNYIARLKFQEPIENGLKEMRDHVESQRYSGNYDELTRLANQVTDRARAKDPNDYTGAYTDWTKRLGTWSYIDRMMRPSHLILHQTHLPMITAPIIAGRHGLADTYGMMIKTWKQATRAYKAGGEDFINSIADSMHKGTNYGDMFKESFKGEKDAKRLGEMWDKLTEIGWLHPQSNSEIQKYMPATQKGGVLGGMDRAIQKFDTVFRHLTNSTEAINRFVGASMAYRLEFAKLTREGMKEADAHAKAIDYARDTISNTQGVYSSTNAAPIFKNKWLRPFLQFRQFPNMIYNLLARTTIKAFKGDTREERVQAAASVALLLGTHTAMTGILGGLPMEAFKIAGMVSRGLGLTQGDWNDVEQAVSDKVLETMGHTMGELVLHGAGRYANVDVHHRMGLNSFFTFGMPDKLDSTNMWAWMGKQIAGAPGGLAEDTFRGIHQMMNGDFHGGMMRAMPLQMLRDVGRAWEGGSKSTTGYQYQGAGDTAARLLGFTPASEAEFYEKKAQTYRTVERYNDQRSELMRTWSTSKPERREEVWSRIQAWNKDKPKDAQITKGDLIKSLNRRESSDRINGIPVNSHNRWAVESSASLN